MIATGFGPGRFAMDTELDAEAAYDVRGFGPGRFAMGAEREVPSGQSLLRYGTGCFAMGNKLSARQISSQTALDPNPDGSHQAPKRLSETSRNKHA